MKTRKIYLLALTVILTAVIVPFIISNCSQGNTTFVTINLNDTRQAAVEEKSLMDRFMGLFVTRAMAQTSWLSDKQSVKIFVEGPGMDNIEEEIPVTADSYTMELVAGIERKITVRIYDSSGNRNAAGYVIKDLVAGDDITVTIYIIPIMNITVSGGSTDMNISYDPYVSATGYNIYRSLSPDGPYDYLGTSASNSYFDYPSYGITYYYKVSAITSNGEGELSDPKSGTLF